MEDLVIVNSNNNIHKSPVPQTKGTVFLLLEEPLISGSKHQSVDKYQDAEDLQHFPKLKWRDLRKEKFSFTLLPLPPRHRSHKIKSPNNLIVINY